MLANIHTIFDVKLNVRARFGTVNVSHQLGLRAYTNFLLLPMFASEYKHNVLVFLKLIKTIIVFIKVKSFFLTL